jgi:hypothetical protein
MSGLRHPIYDEDSDSWREQICRCGRVLRPGGQHLPIELLSGAEETPRGGLGEGDAEIWSRSSR